VQAVSDEAIDLRDRLTELQQDHLVFELVPCLVGGASRIQELTNDLLACSRFASEANEHALTLG
jgi:hypothetical protein